MREQIVGDIAHFEQRVALADEYQEVAAEMHSNGPRPAWGQMLGDASSQLGRVLAMYSRGDAIGELRSAYADLPEMVSRDLPINPTRRFNPGEVGSGFNDFLWVVSMTVLFDDMDGAAVLAEAVERFEMRDFLVDSFLGALIEFREPSQSLQLEIISDFQGVEPVLRSHEPLKEAAQLAASEADAAASALTKYVSKDWYRLHSWTGWHDKHNSRRGSENYAGYWCLEGAAVAKVFNIDDSALETCKYYPWDLVHQ